MKRHLQAVAPSAEKPFRDEHVADSSPQFLLTDEAAALLRFEGKHATKLFVKWANRWNVPRLHRGRTLLWQRRILLDFLAQKRWTKRRSA